MTAPIITTAVIRHKCQAFVWLLLPFLVPDIGTLITVVIKHVVLTIEEHFRNAAIKKGSRTTLNDGKLKLSRPYEHEMERGLCHFCAHIG